MNHEIVATLLNASQSRHSVRNFLPKALSNDIVSELDAFIKELEVPFQHNTSIKHFKAEPGKKLYNNGINAPDNLAVFAQTDLLSVSKAGFCGQLVVLKLTSLGVDTCWFGHYKLQELAKYVGEELAAKDRIRETTWGMGYGYGKVIDAGERAICCIACGYANPGAKRLVDKVASKNGIGRKPLPELMEKDSDLALLPERVVRALDYARLAPSAANSQMWRFGIHEGGKTITVAKPIGYKHFKWEHPDTDIGICAAHLWLGLLNEGFAPEVEVKPDFDRAMWSFHLE
jgi:nitroreductase